MLFVSSCEYRCTVNRNLVNPKFCRIVTLTLTIVRHPYVQQERYRPSQCLPGCLLHFEAFSLFFVPLQRSHHSLCLLSTLNNVVLTFLRAWQITPVQFIRRKEKDVVHLRARVKPQEEATKVRSSMGKYLEASMEGRRKTRLFTANGEIIISARESFKSI